MRNNESGFLNFRSTFDLYKSADFDGNLNNFDYVGLSFQLMDIWKCQLRLNCAKLFAFQGTPDQTSPLKNGR
jgi:hypothetical protein